MKKTVLVFGLISGALGALTMLISVQFISASNYRKSEIFGYTGIVLAALLVFFGIRSYRENVAGGRMTFGRGLAVGVLITLISSACYVATWQILYFGVMPGIGDKLAACMVDRAKSTGASPEKLEAVVQQTESFKRLWSNPVTNAAITFAEPFPIGLGAALLSAALLRRK